jgi:heme-degrading monooxygenase HmoA
MFARKVAVRLKPDSLGQFTNLMERAILPWLRLQPGFLDLITLAAPDGSEVATISFWDQEGNAQAYNSSGYPEALKILEELLDGNPYVKTFDVVSSTFHPSHDTQSEKKNEPPASAEESPTQLVAYRS